MSATDLYAPQVYVVPVGATRIISVDFTNQLESGELLTGTPTVVEQVSSDLTLDNKAVSTAILDINKNSAVAVGAAVQFRVSGQLDNTLYSISITCGTDASPAQTLVGAVRIRGRAIN